MKVVSVVKDRPSQYPSSIHSHEIWIEQTRNSLLSAIIASKVTSIITTILVTILVCFLLIIIVHCIGNQHSTDQTTTNTKCRCTSSAHTTLLRSTISSIARLAVALLITTNSVMWLLWFHERAHSTTAMA